jgi:hypothetical protein
MRRASGLAPLPEPVTPGPARDGQALELRLPHHSSGGLEAERDQFRGFDLLELAVNILLVCKRQSTSMVYDTRWAAFDSW